MQIWLWALAEAKGIVCIKGRHYAKFLYIYLIETIHKRTFSVAVLGALCQDNDHIYEEHNQMTRPFSHDTLYFLMIHHIPYITSHKISIAGATVWITIWSTLCDLFTYLF